MVPVLELDYLNLAFLWWWVTELRFASRLCQAIGMAKKRTKADRLERQTEQLERKADRNPDDVEKKKTTRDDVNEIPSQTVREMTEGR